MRDSKCSGCRGQLMRRVGVEQTTSVFGEEVFESMHSTFCGLARERVARTETCGSIIDNQGIAVAGRRSAVFGLCDRVVGCRLIAECKRARAVLTTMLFLCILAI